MCSTDLFHVFIMWCFIVSISAAFLLENVFILNWNCQYLRSCSWFPNKMILISSQQFKNLRSMIFLSHFEHWILMCRILNPVTSIPNCNVYIFVESSGFLFLIFFSLKESVLLCNKEQSISSHIRPVGSAAPVWRKFGFSSLCTWGNREDTNQTFTGFRNSHRGARLYLQQTEWTLRKHGCPGHSWMDSGQFWEDMEKTDTVATHYVCFLIPNLKRNTFGWQGLQMKSNVNHAALLKGTLNVQKGFSKKPSTSVGI